VDDRPAARAVVPTFVLDREEQQRVTLAPMDLNRWTVYGAWTPSSMTENDDNENGFTLSTHFSADLNSADWISQAEAARIRDISRQAIARLVRKGRFQTIKVGGRVLIRRTEVENFKAEPPGRPSKK
jgi:excisionase family DNA binding protein